MADVWTEKVLKLIQENPSKTPGSDGSGYGIWVIQKFKNGASQSVKVYCGAYYKDKKTGNRKYPMYGMSVRDFETLKPHYAEFKALSANPPAAPGATAPDEGAQDDLPYE